MDVQARGAGGLSAQLYRQIGSAELLARQTGQAAGSAAPAAGSAAPAAPPAQSAGRASSAGLMAPAAGGANATSQTLFNAQMIGQSDEPELAAADEAAETPESAGASSGEVTASDDDNGWSAAEQAFMDFMSMTPAERYRQMFLADEGLTEEDLAAMSPEDRAKIETKIRERIDAAVKDQATEGVGDTASAEAGAAPQAPAAAAAPPPPQVAGADAVPGTGAPGDALGFGDGSDLDEMIRLATRA